MLKRFDLKGKVILLTGGTGIYGRGLTADLAAANATLIIASRDASTCNQVAEEERSKGRDVHTYSYDQADEASIVSLKDKILQRFGRIDGLVNNSVLRIMVGPDGRTEDWDTSMAVNARGLFLMHRHFGNAMQKRNAGSIVNIGSIQGMVGPSLELYTDLDMGIGAPDYFFHKGGMLNLTRYYASVLGKNGIRVNCLSPGGFQFNQPDVFVQRYNQKTFLGRMGTTEDLGGAVVFLLSDASCYVTGTNIPIDGGYTAR